MIGTVIVIYFTLLGVEASRGAVAQVCDCKRGRLWVGFLFAELNI